MPSDSTDVHRYRLAPALVARMLGRGLVALGVVVLLTTVLDAVTGVGWSAVALVDVVGLLLLGGWAWWLHRSWVVRLSPAGYAVRLLPRVGVSEAAWSQVSEAVATAPGGRACLVLHLTDGRSTVLPVAALAGDRDAFAHVVRRLLRDAHTPTDDRPDDASEGASADAGPDSAPAEDCL